MTSKSIVTLCGKQTTDFAKHLTQPDKPYSLLICGFTVNQKI